MACRRSVAKLTSGAEGGDHSREGGREYQRVGHDGLEQRVACHISGAEPGDQNARKLCTDLAAEPDDGQFGSVGSEDRPILPLQLDCQRADPAPGGGPMPTSISLHRRLGSPLLPIVQGEMHGKNDRD